MHKTLLPFLAGCAVCVTPAFAQNTTSLTHEVVLSDLEAPWDMAVLEDGTMFYTEK